MGENTGSRGEGHVTRLLRQASDGDEAAEQHLYESIYGELRRLAHAHMRKAPGQTLQPTALVHEAWLRLVQAELHRAEYRDREHFLVVASRAMRSALIDHVRRRKTQKRGGQMERVSLDVVIELHEERGVDLMELDEALGRLEAEEPRQGRVVSMRFFGGLSLTEVARALEISRATAYRDWELARIWLREELRAEPA